ncbi:phage terminase large subunit family protein [Bradyrhizobium sp. Arg237L]|uniref:terminase gpA endonuclease subunit n=1 Tax=Bradyrhizobium sp. Arg237L TaxID=3003352 RepID=UPI00249F8865|nr:terminase gpA endonuclease subunit [Bradyrhizobium sp. Arg237L]MDI4231436.1 phage terminase large subunit family protein [Bradyrhizobium sp. Arg237L]
MNAPALNVPAYRNARELVARSLGDSIRPPVPVPFSKWLTENLVLVDGEHAGELWSADGAPYLPEIADCLSDDHPCNLVTVRKAQQTGASILALGWCLYIADREPANILYGMPNIDALRDLNSQKLQPLIDAWHKKIKRTVILPQTSRSSAGSTTYEKKFSGGYLALANANAVMDLSSKTVRKGVKDEVSKWQDIPGYGDPEDLFFGRFTAFRRTKSWKILEISTPEVDSGDELGEGDGHCRIDRSFRRSDQRFWNCICPECRQPFVHQDEFLRVDDKHPHRTKYECRCGHLITESERVIAIKPSSGARWVAKHPEVTDHPGFHIDAFISMMMSYEAIAEDRLGAKSEIEKKAYNNLVLALPHKYRGDAPDHEKLLARVEKHLKRGHVPPQGLILVAFADVQMRGLWLEVMAIAPNRETWCVEALYIDGDTSQATGAVFQQLKKETIDREFPDAFGRMRKIDALGIDSGFRANVVYAFARANQRPHPDTGRDLILATKGLPGWGRPALGQPTLVDIDLDGKKIRQGAKVWGIGTWPLKASFYSDLRQEIPGPPAEPIAPDSYCHFGDWCDEVYFKQLTGEQLEDVKYRGRTVTQQWVKIRENHFHDCRVGNMALAEYLGVSSTTPEQWAALAIARGLPPELSEPSLFTPRAAAPAIDAKDAQAAIARRKAEERGEQQEPSDTTQGWLDGYEVKF